MADNELGVRISVTETGGDAAGQVSARLRQVGVAAQLSSADIARLGPAAQAAVRATLALGSASTEAAGGLARQATSANVAAAANVRLAASSSSVARESRHIVAGFDELASGRHGQFVSTLGAAMRDSGAGTTMLMGGIAALSAVMAGLAIGKKAEEMGKWAEATKAAAASTGMSISQYSQLQGALELTGLKGGQADAALRGFATHLEQATANAASRSAKAFHALGISQQELIALNGNVEKGLLRTADAFQQHASNANSAAAMQALFNRSDAAMANALESGSHGLIEQQNRAQALGITLDDVSANKLTTMYGKIETLAATLRGEGVQSMIQWSNAIGKAADSLTELVKVIGTVSGALASMDASLAATGGIFGQFIAAVQPAVSILLQFKSALSNIGGGGIADDIIRSGAKLAGKSRASSEGTILGIMGANVGSTQATSMDLGTVDVTAKPGVPAFDVPKEKKPSQAAAHKEYQAELAEDQQAIDDLRKKQQLANEQQDAGFDRARLQARIQAADKDLSPTQRAQSEFDAFQKAAEQKIAAAQSFETQASALYDKLAAEAAKVYGEDSAQYKKAVGEKTQALDQFGIEERKINNQILQHALEVVQPYKAEVQQVIDQWASAFNQIGSQIETTIQGAIKSAFVPQQAEYWWSSMSGPKGQPLMEAHRINPVTQMLGNLGTSVLGDLGKQLGTSIADSIAKSMSGGAASTIGQLIAKGIGIGSPGGLFGTGIGAVTGLAAQTPEVTAITASTTAITAAIATSSAGIIAALQELVAVDTATAVKPSVLGTTYSFGGIVPSAAGGMVVGGGGGIPSILHAREMVLPADLSHGIQESIRSGQGLGNDFHMHFHGPADAPSISRWFRENMISNAGAIRQMFRQNALSTRTL